MPGILEGLRDVFGGFADVKQIDESGFDFREKRAQDEFLRQRQRELAQQSNEDRALKIGEDVMAGAEGEAAPDVSALFPAGMDERRRRLYIESLAGRAKERKSALEDQRTSRGLLQQQLRGTQRLDEIGLAGELATERDRLREKLRSERTLNPAEQARLDSLEKMSADRIAAGDRRASTARTGRGRVMDYFDPTEQKNVRRWVPQGELEGSSFEPPLPATMRQGQGMIEGVQANVDKMAELADAGLTSGPIIGAASKKWQEFMGPSGPEGEFDFLGNAVVDTVYAKSGKQINQNEQKILEKMIPNRARGNLPEQVRLFDEYVKHLFAKYGGATRGPRPGQPPPAGGRERMVKYRGKLVPLSSLPPELQAKVPR
jgi:hypothetical protein